MAIDEQLIKQIKQGKSEAFGQLFRKYQKKVYSICLSIVKEPHDAEEVTQDTFVHAYLKIGQLRKPEKFSSWLKRIAQNRSKNYLNSKQEKTVPLVAATEDISTQPTPDRLLLKRELIDAIIEAIESLPQEDKEIIRARIDGLSHSEISERFGISISTSTTRLYRIRKKIKARVKELLSAIIGLPKMLPLKKIISGGITAMKLGTSTKATVGVIGAIVAGFIGFQTVTHKETQQKVEPSEKVTEKRIAKPKSQPKTVRPSSDDEESIQFEQYSDKEEVPNAKIPNKAKVPTAQNSDEEIRAFLAWLKSLDRQDSSDETEKDESNIEEKGIDYTQEKELIESVIWGRWKKGYETQDVERYMSSIWEDDFFYTSDIGTPNDPSDDVIFRGGQQERESALTVFNQTENIELNLSPRSDIEFLSDTNAMVEYDYEIIFSNYYQPFPEVKLETISASGNMTFILERRENSEGIDEWKIIEWYDYAQK